MAETIYRNRRAVEITDGQVTLTVLREGGHIASILEHGTGINPLWTPAWPSIEPSVWSAASCPEYGADADARLLAGIMGHNLCLDLFGGPSDAEAACGIDVHGEASVADYAIEESGSGLRMSASLPLAQLRFERQIELRDGVVLIHETVKNLMGVDRAIAWTEHVTLGAPFVERGVTRFLVTATRSKVIESDFTGGIGVQKQGAEFDWPMCPRRDGGVLDLSTYSPDAVSGGYTAHLMDPSHEYVHFTAHHPPSGLLFGYMWRRADFPWLGRWEENHLRTHAPWNGREVTCGMEFGVSPMPETRREMLARGTLFDVPCYRWIEARSTVRVSYCAFARRAAALPHEVRWDGGFGVELR